MKTKEIKVKKTCKDKHHKDDAEYCGECLRNAGFYMTDKLKKKTRKKKA